MKSITYWKGYIINKGVAEGILIRLPGTERTATKSCAITPKKCKIQVKIL